MRVSIEFADGIIDGESKRFFEAHINSDVVFFTQRKSYDEYYYDCIGYWEVDIHTLEGFASFFGTVVFRSGIITIGD